MGFNKNTWTKDYAGSAGLSTLAKQDAARKGYKPKSKTKANSRLTGSTTNKGNN